MGRLQLITKVPDHVAFWFTRFDSEKQSADKLQAIIRIESDTTLRKITKPEVVAFVLDQMQNDEYLHAKVFIGHT